LLLLLLLLLLLSLFLMLLLQLLWSLFFLLLLLLLVLLLLLSLFSKLLLQLLLSLFLLLLLLLQVGHWLMLYHTFNDGSTDPAYQETEPKIPASLQNLCETDSQPLDFTPSIPPPVNTTTSTLTGGLTGGLTNSSGSVNVNATNNGNSSNSSSNASTAAATAADTAAKPLPDKAPLQPVPHVAPYIFSLQGFDRLPINTSRLNLTIITSNRLVTENADLARVLDARYRALGCGVNNTQVYGPRTCRLQRQADDYRNYMDILPDGCYSTFTQEQVRL
jgi:hypothetical protein